MRVLCPFLENYNEKFRNLMLTHAIHHANNGWSNAHFFPKKDLSKTEYILGKSLFWPSNFCLSLILSIELQNRISLTIQLLKPFTIGH
jgi:hypothetical protein